MRLTAAMIDHEMAAVGGDRPLAFLLRLGPPRAGFSFHLLTARPIPQSVHSPLDRIKATAQVDICSRRRGIAPRIRAIREAVAPVSGRYAALGREPIRA